MNIPNTHNLTMDDLKSYMGAKTFEQMNDDVRSLDHRVGQAFMNNLDRADYTKLTGSLYDPFHKDNWGFVLEALAYLLL